MLKFLQGLLSKRSTDAREGHTTIHQSEERFAQFVARVRDYAVFLLDRQGNVITWNEGAEHIKGYHPAEIIGQHFSRFYPREAVLAGWPAHELAEAARTGRFEDEGWRVRKDGSQFWANVVITALRGPSGEVHGFLKITRDVTDRKQAEAKMRLSEERFRLMVEAVKDYAIFMLDPRGRVATWNAGAERLKGYKAEEIIGEHFSRFYPKEAVDRGWPDEELRRATADGRFEDEGWRVRKDGSQFWANVVITSVRDERGALRGFAKVTRDLTQQREAEENARRLLQEEAARHAAEHAAREIQRQKDQLRVTLASIGDAVIVTDPNAVITFLNPMAEKLTGWSLAEAVGQRLETVFHVVNETTRQPLVNPVARVLDCGNPVCLENHTLLVARDGREFPIDDCGAPIRGEDKVVAGVVLVFRDITEARRAVDARLRLAAIVESSDDAIIGQNLAGTITSWNKGAERLFGYTAEEAIGQPLAMLAPSDHPDELPSIMDQILTGQYIEHYETVRMRKDGSQVHVSLTISPIRDGGGHIVGASKIARDITLRKEEDRRKNEFLALLAHELRNPMAPLRNGLEVMRLAGKDVKTLEQARAIMERQVQHMARLIDDLLDIGRISQGKIRLRKERLSVRGVIDHTLELCEGHIKDRDPPLTVSVADETMHVDADKTRIAQVLCNLLGNAVKYSDPGRPIVLSARRDGEQAAFSVKDSGVGIPPEMLARIFDPFYQLDRSLEKSQGGLGIGLTIVKRLVEMHGGSVEAHSEGLGRGSEFVVKLPLVHPATHAAEKSSEPSSPPTATRRILVVDDNVDAATSLATLLKMMGNDIQTAHDGIAAVEAANAFRPDLILLDIGMPGMNGYDACRRIREERWAKDAVIVALTGWGQDDDIRQSREAGFDLHMLKPVEPAALESLLTEAKP
jgi:PAS domain S-box-containing protein